MRVQVRTIRVRGELVANAALTLQAPLYGRLSIKERKDHRLGQVVRIARPTDLNEPGNIDLMPELRDVHLLAVDDDLLVLAGCERVDDKNFAQSWEVELE
jgi:hypothetical protein